MSLLLDALDRAERARREQRSLASPELGLEPREGEGIRLDGAVNDGAALFELDASPRRRPWLLIALGVLLLVLVLAGGALYYTLATPTTGPAVPLAGRAATPPAPATSASLAGQRPPASPAGGNRSPAVVPPAPVGSPAPATVSARPAAGTPSRPDAATGEVLATRRPGAAGGRTAAPLIPADSAAARPGLAAPEEHAGTARPRDIAPVDLALFRTPARQFAPDPQLLSAWAALRDGRLDEARKGYSELEARSPANPDVQLGLGRLEAQQGHPDEARRHYRRALELDPRNAAASAALALLVPSGEDAGGDSRLRSRAAGQDSDARYALAVRLSAAGDWPQAEQAWFEVLRDRPEDPDVLCNLAVSLDHLGQVAAARQYYQAALQAATRQAAHFDRSQVTQRLAALGG